MEECNVLQVVVDACSQEPRGAPITSAEHSHAVILQQALHHIPNHSTEFTTRNVAIRLGQQLAEQVAVIVLYTNPTDLWIQSYEL